LLLFRFGFRRARGGDQGLNFTSHVDVWFIDRFVGLVAPTLDDFSDDGKLPVLVVDCVKQAVHRLEENQHLIVPSVVVLGASDARSRQHVDLSQREIALDHVQGIENRHLVELATVSRPFDFVNFDTRDKNRLPRDLVNGHDAQTVRRLRQPRQNK